MSRQIPFTRHEAVLLLDTYLSVQERHIARMEAVRQCSDALRSMAINNGLTIDDAYRNRRGISFQMASMESAFQGKTITVPATRLFIDTVELYRAHNMQYHQLLKEAKDMANQNQDNKDMFMSWLSENVFPAQVHELSSALHEIELQAKKVKLIKHSLYETLNPMTIKKIRVNIEQSKIFRFTHKSQWAHILLALDYLMRYTNQTVANIDIDRDKDIADDSISDPDVNLRVSLIDKKAFDKESQNVGMQRIAHDSVSELPLKATTPQGKILKSNHHTCQYYREDKETFYRWLKDDQHMAENTCRSYVSAVRCAEKFAEEHGISPKRLYTDNREEAKATADALFSNQEFLKYNNDQHNRFKVAIDKLLEAINAGAFLKTISASRGELDTSKAMKIEKNEEIVKVLKAHYEYGFKFDSIRELMRFRQFADAMGISLPEEDETLKDIILVSGRIIDDKVYCKDNDMLRELQHMIGDVESSGANVIYFDSLFESEQEWMASYVITSPSMLKEYLRDNIKEWSISRKFMVKGDKRTEKEAVSDELKRVWGDCPLESVSNLCNRLPYIPIENIWRTISGNDLFVWSSEGEYLLIDRFHITEEEEENILEFVDESCEEKGFASLNDIPLGSTEEENYELPRITIQNAVYKKVLSGKYHLNGKILTKEKSELDTVMLLKQYIKGKDECTFDEVADKVVELTGSTNRQYAFQALYDDMVRVDRNRFVANRLVNFSVDEIDSVLEGFITDHFRAIRDVTTFAMFPLCEQSWNHYLLESFCYKYSRKYSLHVIHFNDKNAGIIAEKGFNKKYNEMLAVALARTDVELSPEVIGQYLFNTGYMAKSKYAMLGEIAQRALEIRKER